MIRKAKAQCTIETYIKALKELAKRANLKNPVDVEIKIARYHNLNEHGKPASNRWKAQCCLAYAMYCEVFEMKWQKPTYKIDEHSIQPPTPEKMLMLMSSAKSTLSIKIDISVQTGLRPCEITGDVKGLLVKDIHPDTHTITATSAKGCFARPPLKITPELTMKIQTYIFTHKLQPEERLFHERPQKYGDT